MAFPSASTATTNGSTATTSAVVSLPGSIVAGQTLLVLIRCALGGTHTFPAGWTEIFEDSSDGSDDTTSLAWRRADGTEGASITVTLGTSSKFSAISWLVAGARNPELSPPEISNITTGNSTNPNPGSLTPSGGAQDYLWLWMGGWEGTQTSPPVGNPTNYTSNVVGADTGSTGGVSTNCRVASASRQLNAATEDPGSWTISGLGDDWTAVTVAIYPEVISEETIGKDAEYVVGSPDVIPLGIEYAVETSPTEARSLDYLTAATGTQMKELGYRLPPSVAPSRVSYSVIIENSSGDITEFEKISSLSYELYENEVGICKFLLPYSDSKLTPGNVEGGKGIVRIYRQGILVWQGIISVVENTKDGSTIYGFDFKETLKWYRIGFNKNTPEKDFPDGNLFDDRRIGSQIISPIWDFIVGASPYPAKVNPFLGGVVSKGTIQNPYNINTTTPKTVKFSREDQDFFTFLTYMTALSRADSPGAGSWKQDTVFDISISETGPTFTFLRNVGEDKPEVRLELDSEITNFTLTEDASNIRNNVRGMTVTDNPEVLSNTQNDAASNSAYYLREISQFFSAADKPSSLAEQTKDYLKEHKDVMPEVAAEFASGIAPFDGYAMGDAVKLLVNRGRVVIDDYYRVIGMRVGYEAGVELTVPILRKKRT